MSVDLVNPPPRISPATALRISQQAPLVLQSSTTNLPYPLSLLLATESQESWIEYENLVLSCLRTGDDKSAKALLDRLVLRFGDDNEKVMALQALYAEAKAGDNKSLDSTLRQYDELLQEEPTNMPIRKRRIALLRSMGRPVDAISGLVELLESSPTDAEAWAELSDSYLSQGLYSQAIYSLEEVLLMAPNAWNIQARMGEVLYLAATANASNVDAMLVHRLSESMRRFCRSIELCDNYLRGYYGLSLATKRLIDVLPKASKLSFSDEDLYPPELDTIQRLHEAAIGKLSKITRRSSAAEAGWTDFDPAEVIAAQELLDHETQQKVR